LSDFYRMKLIILPIVLLSIPCWGQSSTCSDCGAGESGSTTPPQNHLPEASSTNSSSYFVLPSYDDCQEDPDGELLLSYRFDTIYNWACGGSWNGAPFGPNNQPTDHQRQLALDLNLYQGAGDTLLVEVANLITGNGIWVSGGCFTGFTLTGILIETQGISAVDLNRASEGQELVSGSTNNLSPMCSLQGWNASIGASSTSVSTSSCPNYGATRFGSISGATRIRGDLHFAIVTTTDFDPTSMEVSAVFGCGQQIITPICQSAPTLEAVNVTATTGIEESDGQVLIGIEGDGPFDFFLLDDSGNPYSFSQNGLLMTGLAAGSYILSASDLDGCPAISGTTGTTTAGILPATLEFYVPYSLCCGGCDVHDVDTDGICDDEDNCTDRMAPNFNDPANTPCED